MIVSKKLKNCNETFVKCLTIKYRYFFDDMSITLCIFTLISLPSNFRFGLYEWMVKIKKLFTQFKELGHSKNVKNRCFCLNMYFRVLKIRYNWSNIEKAIIDKVTRSRTKRFMILLNVSDLL